MNVRMNFFCSATTNLCGHQAAEEREPDVFLWQGGGTEEAVKQENKR